MRSDRSLNEILAVINNMAEDQIMCCTKGEYNLLLRRFTISREEAEVLVKQLMREWVPGEYQKIIYNLITRLETELNET